MKFVCGTAELSEACLNVQRAVSTKTSIPAVEGILIKAVRVSSFSRAMTFNSA